MKWSTITTIFLLAGSALSAPVTSTTAELNISDELRNQGDGFYTATLNEDGKFDVNFTPMAEIVARDASPVPEIPVITHPTPPGNEIHCGPGSANNVPDLDTANVQLARNAPGGLSTGSYGWVHLNEQTSFWCNYRQNFLTYDLVFGMHIALSKKCGGSAVYGYTHDTDENGAKNLAVGRTFTGDHFCTKNFRGKRETAPMPALKPFTVAEHLMKQGNGLYIAKFNEAGEAAVDFTPASEMPSFDITTANLAAKNVGPLHKRDGVECVEGTSKNLDDLNFANIMVAKTVQGVFYDAGTFIWYENNKETSYACAYRAWHGLYDTVIQYHTDLSGACTHHDSDYGYKRHAARGEKDINLSVGRTYTGNRFCEKHFHPPRRQVEEPAPTPTTYAIPKNLMQQGDGFYLATFNKSGQVSVEFTPAARLPALNITLPASNNTTHTTENPAAKRIGSLRKRGETHCDGSDTKNLGDLTWANIQLANIVRDKTFESQWGWFHNYGETSYFCVYAVWAGNSDTINGFHKSISDNCNGEAGYGFRRHFGLVWDSDYQLAVGRTWRGDNFCDSDFHGKPGKRLAASIEPIEKPTELSRRDTIDYVDKPAELSLRDGNPMDQGDGLHQAWVDKNGILQVKFTPISELLADEPLADPLAEQSTAAFSKESITCVREFKFSDRVEDLDYANVRLARSRERAGEKLESNKYYWVIYGQETSYACTGTKTHMTYNDIIHMHTSISDTCGGSAAYGYNRMNPGWDLDITIGRTWRGGSICNKDFKPYKAKVAKTFAPSRRSTSSDLNIASDLMFQGDGFYTATVDDFGTVDVNFTPMAQLPPTAELLSKARAEGLLDHTSDSTDSLHKRNTECEGRDSGSQSDLDGANIQLAHNGDGKTYSPRAWGWVHNNGETSYFCPYTRVKVSYKEVIEMHTITSRKCGAAAYGWDHRYVLQGKRFSIGRTFKGNHFCTDTFTGSRAVRAIETPSVDSAAIDSAPVRAASLAADAASWDMTSAQMDQGDGLYVASRDDETGQMSVKFTPIAKLSSRASLADASSWDMTSAQMDQGDGLYIASFDDETGQMSIEFTPIAELSSSVSHAPVSSNSDADIISDLNKRQGDKTSCARGSSKNVADLDSANRQLAEAGSEIDLKHKRVGWVHINRETSYWCADKSPHDWRYPYGYFISQQTIVSNTCGGIAGYGGNTFEGYTVAPPSTTDTKAYWTKMSVGRTMRGTSICSQKFTPPAAASTVESSNISSKRDSVKQTCRGGLSKSVPDLDYVNSEIANYGDQLNLKKNPITWLHKNGETSYWCFSQGADGWSTNADYFINEQIKISNHCDGGSAAYGWSHARGYKKFNGWSVWTELSVGRTFKGGSICRKEFIPPPAAASIEAAPIEAAPIKVAPRSTTFDARNQGEGFYLETFNDAGESTIKTHRDEAFQDQSVTTHAVKSMRQRSDLLQQGDGLYHETVNEAGERTVNFTPIAELAAFLTAQTAANENVAATTTGTLHQNYQKSAIYCKGYSQNTPDLDHANIALAALQDSVYLENYHWAVFVKGKELSYICSYTGYKGKESDIIDAQKRVSAKCEGGSQRYGWEYRANGVSVGRTWYGDHYCK